MYYKVYCKAKDIWQFYLLEKYLPVSATNGHYYVIETAESTK